MIMMYLNCYAEKFDDGYADDLRFSFTRLPVDVIEQNIDEYSIKQYYNVSKG